MYICSDFELNATYPPGLFLVCTWDLLDPAEVLDLGAISNSAEYAVAPSGLDSGRFRAVVSAREMLIIVEVRVPRLRTTKFDTVMPRYVKPLDRMAVDDVPAYRRKRLSHGDIWQGP